MSRRIKVLVAVLAAVLLLTVSGTAAVMAQEEPEPTPQANGFLARVAEILGIPQESLAEAFQQARQEMKPENCEQTGQQMRQMRQELRQARQELRQQWQQMRQEANGECDQARQQLRQARQELRQQWQELRQGATID